MVDVRGTTTLLHLQGKSHSQQGGVQGVSVDVVDLGDARHVYCQGCAAAVGVLRWDSVYTTTPLCITVHHWRTVRCAGGSGVLRWDSVYCGVQWCTVVYSGVQRRTWCTVVYSGVQWCTVANSGVQRWAELHRRPDALSEGV